MNRPRVYFFLHGETQRLEGRDVLSELGDRVRPWESDDTIEMTSEWLAEASR